MASNKLTHVHMINNDKFADVQINLGKKAFYAHACVLQQRCPALIGNISKLKKKKGMWIKDLDKNELTEKLLLDILHYAYTGSGAVENLSSRQLLDLFIASANFGLDRLKWECEAFLSKGLSMDNIFDMLKAADQARALRVKEFCLDFILQNYDQFIANKNAKKLGVDLFQEVVATQAGNFTKPELGECPPDTMRHDFKIIYEATKIPYDAKNPKFKDMAEVMSFKCGPPQYKGFVSAHRAILAAATPALSLLCSQAVVARSKEGPEHINVPPTKAYEGPKGREKEVRIDVSKESFQALVKYVYYRDADGLSTITACELLPIAKDYGLTDLVQISTDKVMNSYDNTSVLKVLELTYLPHMDAVSDPALKGKLREAATDYILQNINSVNLEPLKHMNPSIAVDLLFARQQFEKRG